MKMRRTKSLRRNVWIVYIATVVFLMIVSHWMWVFMLGFILWLPTVIFDVLTGGDPNVGMPYGLFKDDED